MRTRWCVAGHSLLCSRCLALTGAVGGLHRKTDESDVNEKVSRQAAFTLASRLGVGGEGLQ